MSCNTGVAHGSLGLKRQGYIYTIIFYKTTYQIVCKVMLKLHNKQLPREIVDGAITHYYTTYLLLFLYLSYLNIYIKTKKYYCIHMFYFSSCLQYVSINFCIPLVGYEPADLTVHPPPKNDRGWVHFFRIGV